MAKNQRLYPMICSAIGVTAFIWLEPLKAFKDACIVQLGGQASVCTSLSLLSATATMTMLGLSIFYLFDKVIWNTPWINAVVFGSKRGTWLYCSDASILSPGHDSNKTEVVGFFYFDHEPSNAQVASAQVYYRNDGDNSGKLNLRGTWVSQAISMTSNDLVIVYKITLVTPVNSESLQDQQYSAIFSLERAMDKPIFHREAFRGKVSGATKNGRLLNGDVYCERISWGRNISAQAALKKYIKKRKLLIERIRTSGSFPTENIPQEISELTRAN